MSSKTGDIFLNGKAQMVEMLQYMEPDERARLLKQVRLRNAPLADELSIGSVSFKHIINMTDHEIKLVLNYIQAPIMGVAMKSLPINSQRKILSVADRQYAEEAYQLMTTQLNNEERDVERAVSKVKGVIATLVKRKQVSL